MIYSLPDVLSLKFLVSAKLKSIFNNREIEHLVYLTNINVLVKLANLSPKVFIEESIENWIDHWNRIV